jgi:hypothetical protein
MPRSPVVGGRVGAASTAGGEGRRRQQAPPPQPPPQQRLRQRRLQLEQAGPPQQQQAAAAAAAADRPHLRLKQKTTDALRVRRSEHAHASDAAPASSNRFTAISRRHKMLKQVGITSCTPCSDAPALV